MADSLYSIHSNRWEILCKPKHRSVAPRSTRVSAAKYTQKPYLLSKMMLLAQTAPGTLLLTASVEGVSNQTLCQSYTGIRFNGAPIWLLSALISEMKNYENHDIYLEKQWSWRQCPAFTIEAFPYRKQLKFRDFSLSSPRLCKLCSVMRISTTPFHFQCAVCTENTGRRLIL